MTDPEARQGRWWHYLLAHHGLDDDEHVMWLGTGRHAIPFCARCTGLYLTAILWASMHFLATKNDYAGSYSDARVQLVLVLLALPLLVQWTWQTLSRRRFFARTRLLTGIFAGIPLGAVLVTRESLLIYAALLVMAHFLVLRGLAYLYWRRDRVPVRRARGKA